MLLPVQLEQFCNAQKVKIQQHTSLHTTCLDKFIEGNGVISICVGLLDCSVSNAAKLFI